MSDKLIPFDLEAAKAGAPVITRDGSSARIVCWDGEAASGGKVFPIVALIGEGAGQMAGLFDVSGVCINNYDGLNLLMAPKRIKKWRVIFRYGEGASHKDFESPHEAMRFCDHQKNNGSISPFKIEVSE